MINESGSTETGLALVDRTNNVRGNGAGFGGHSRARQKTDQTGDQIMQIKTEAGRTHEIKNAAIAFGVYGNGSKRLGDVAVTNRGLVWSNGASKSAKDVTVKWDDFIDWMQSQLPAQGKTASKTAAKSAAKSAKPATKSSAKAAQNGAAPARKAAAKSAPAKKATAASKAPAKAKAAPKKAK